MLQTILDFILFIPRKIYYHFEDYKNLKEENKQLEQEIIDYKRILKRITGVCESNAYNNYELKIRKIKELANAFPNDN